jgi:hypothetical protein
MMNWKGSGRKRSQLNQGNMPAGTEEKPRDSTVRIAGVPTDLEFSEGYVVQILAVAPDSCSSCSSRLAGKCWDSDSFRPQPLPFG